MGKWIFSIFFTCLYSRETLGERKGFVIFFLKWSIVALQCCICIGVQRSYSIMYLHGLPRWLRVKNLPAMQETQVDVGSMPGSGRYPGGRHGSTLQYSCLENIMDRRAWWATVQRVSNSWTQLKWLSTHKHIYIYIYILFPTLLYRDVYNGLLDSEGEGEGGMIWENGNSNMYTIM